MGIKLTNNASATLASSITNSATSISLTTGQGALFPSLSAGDFFYATLVDSSNNLEIVKVTARSGDALTVVRAQDNTTARAFTSGDKLELRPVAAVFTEFVQITGAQTIAGVKTFSEGIVANVTGNAGTVTNGVYTTGNQTIGGLKTLSSKLTVDNTAADDKIMLYSGGSANTTIRFFQSGIFEWWLGMQSGNGAFRLGNGSGYSSTLYTFDTSGNFTAVGNVTAYSDERVKTNWRSVSENFVVSLASVKSGIYDRTDIEATQVGVSAQSLQTLLPESVLEDVNGDLSVAYGNAALVAAIELAKEVVQLQARLEALEAK